MELALEVFNVLKNDQLILISAFIALLLILLWIISSLLKDKSLLAYKTDNGNVHVSRHALTDLIRHICKSEHGISQLKTKIYYKRKRLNIQIRLKLESGSHLKTIENGLQSSIREALSSTLGIESLSRIDILATGIQSKGNRFVDRTDKLDES